MTKTLTEQWREGTLPFGNYYINLVVGVERIDFFEGLKWERTKDFGIEEVLAPVPSYNEVKEMSQKIERLEFDNEALEISRDELEKKLAIAMDTLEMLAHLRKEFDLRYREFAKNGIKQIKDVK